MSYLVLARKWRPQNFAQVTGQDTIIKTLEKSLVSQKIAHAFLFTGGRGIGKTTLARIMAKCLVCEQGIVKNPCGKCHNCQEVTAGTSVDVIEIDGASNTSVDDIRQLKESARYQPSNCRYKIFIIDEVHMLSNSAFNALLKILEEPPPFIKFIFATTESHKIPVTVISRCQRYDFKKFSSSDIINRLTYIFKQEKINISQDAIAVIAKSSDGSMRDALSLSDQVITFSDNPSVDEVCHVLGFVSQNTIFELIDAILHRESKKALVMIDDIFCKGFDLCKVMEALAKQFRNLSISSHIGSIAGLDDLSADEVKIIDDLAKKNNTKDWQRLFSLAVDSCDNLMKCYDAKLSIDLAILSMVDRPLLNDVVSINKAIAKLELLAKNKPNNVNSLPIAADEKKNSIVGEKLAIKPKNTENKYEKWLKSLPIKNVDKKWMSFVRTLIAANPSMGNHLAHGKVDIVKKDNQTEKINLSFSKTIHEQLVKPFISSNFFITEFKKCYGDKVHFATTTAEQMKSNKSSTVADATSVAIKKAQIDLEKEAQNNPVIKHAIALFEGKITSVSKILA